MFNCLPSTLAPKGKKDCPSDSFFSKSISKAILLDFDFVNKTFSYLLGNSSVDSENGSKESQGVAEKRKGRRGPGSVIGSSATGCVCAFLTLYGVSVE
ncbi:hypothetical protein V6N12_023413 [Hibiscus sabdariffa]|uniref:Uncharacterized protein n=1 Tax=Hibiscus sabdariffa TaxID=183260 RepID=A0ABR2FY76_9ROSI